MLFNLIATPTYNYLLMVEDFQEVLRMTPAEQTIFDRHCAIFSVIKCIEFLEVKYANGDIKGPVYHQKFGELYNQL